MKRTYVVFLVLALLVGGIAVTYAAVVENPPEDMACTAERVVVYGWTSKKISMAELAAIAKWQYIVKTKFPGNAQWHLAYKRTMNCRLFEESSHFQCQVSATPCKMRNG